MLLKVMVLAAVVAVANAACGVPGVAPIPPSLRPKAVDMLMDALNGGRIVGGIEAKPNSWPWQVALLPDNDPTASRVNCGGSLIEPQWVLSAGHCCVVSGSTIPKKPEVFNIRLGAHDLRQKGPNDIVVKVVKVVVHPKYANRGPTTPAPAYQDFCLLKLAAPVKLNKDININCLADDKTDAAAGALSVVTGFGRDSQGSPSPILRQAGVTVITNEACAQRYGNRENIVTADMVCVGDNLKGSCNGDSGGPLSYQPKAGGPFIQFGVVSWGSSPTCGSTPGVYGRISTARTWIADTIKAG